MQFKMLKFRKDMNGSQNQEYIDILNDYTSDTGETLAFIFNFFPSMLFAGLVFLILRIFRAKKHG